MNRALPTCAIAAMVSLWTAPAVAEEPSREALDVAAKHFQAGAEQYTAGEYSKAIVEFLKAYNAVPNALFLYNISLSYGKLGNVEDALAAATKARDGVGLDEETANRNVARIAAFERWGTASAVAADVASRPEPSAKGVDVVAEQPRAERPSRFGAVGGIGGAFVAAGAGLMVGAGIIATGVKTDIAEYERAAATGDEARFDELREALSARQSTGKILLFSGAGLGAVGIVLVLLDLASVPEAPPVAVVATPEGPQAIVRVRFR